MNQVTKIFRKNLSKFYLTISSIGIIIGLIISVLCIDIYQKVSNTVMKSGDRNHLIINKKVSLLNTLSLSDNSFDSTEINELRSKNFISKVGEIRASNCRIWAFRDEEPLKFKTDLFFESIQNDFLDKIPYEWKWREEDEFVPVMINSDFLNLYNFAFAKTQNLPQFSASTIGKITVMLETYGNGKNRFFKARIVDVSDRIPSLIVPDNFLTYINNNFGKASDGKFSRLILNVNNPSDPQLVNYLSQQGYVANEDILKSGKSKTVLTQLMGSQVAFALLIISLSIIIASISFELVMAKSKRDIQLLKHLGFTTNEIGEFFFKRFNILFCVQLLFAILGVIAGGYFIKVFIENSGFEKVELISTYSIIALIILATLYFIFFKWRTKQNLKRL